MDRFLKNPVQHWHIKNPRHIHNTVKHLSRNILFKTLCNPDILRALVYSQLVVHSEIKAYSEPCRISKMELFIKNPV